MRASTQFPSLCDSLGFQSENGDTHSGQVFPSQHKVISHRYAHKPIPQVILGSYLINLTSNTITTRTEPTSLDNTATSH